MDGYPCATIACEDARAFAAIHFGDADLGDRRLNRRLARVAADFMKNPQQSLPNQTADWADLTAAYRLFSHGRINPQSIKETHRRLTRLRCGQFPVVLCALDTTELDFTTRRSTTGLGAIGAASATSTIDAASAANESKSQADNPAALRHAVSMIYILVAAKLTRVPPATLTPRQFWRTVARRGGWLGRKCDGRRPGWKSLWQGWHEVQQLVEGAILMQGCDLQADV